MHTPSVMPRPCCACCTDQLPRRVCSSRGHGGRDRQNYLETKNIGLQGAYCVSGTCTGVVVATGDNTVFGRIAQLTNEPKNGLTPLEREVLNFVLVICSIMLVMIIAVIVVW